MPASCELRRLELRKLERRISLDFDYCLRSATIPSDYVFFGDVDRARASKNDLALVEDFVRTFNMTEVNVARPAASR